MKPLNGILLLLLTLITDIYCYNILMATLNSRSHKLLFDVVAEELSRKGHQVTVLSSFKEPSHNNRNIRNVFINMTSIVTDDNDDNSQRLEQEWDYYVRITDEVSTKSRILYEDPFTKDLIKNPTENGKTNSPRFHVVVVDAVYNDFLLPLAHHIGVPSVFLSPSVLFPNVAWNLDIPNFASVIPSPLVEHSGLMNYGARTHNVWVTFRIMHALYFHAYTAVDDTVHKVLPESPSVLELINNVSFVLTNSNPLLNQKITTVPYLAQVGGLHCRQAKKLPQELEKYVQQSRDGIIYVSVNTTISLRARNVLKEAFAQLQENVIWSTELDIKEIPKNVKLVRAAPQQDLLGSGKVKLLIASGSNLDVQEAVYHGCPFLGLPFTTLQLQNSKIASDRGFGSHLNLADATASEVVGAIKELITNQKYKDNVLRLSKLLKDRQNEPIETVTFWIEYVIRNDGAQHLKTNAKHLVFYQYFMFDIQGAVFGIIGAIVLLIIILIVTLTPILGRPNKGLAPKKNK